MRVLFNGEWIADSEDVILLHEPGRYPVAYFPRAAVNACALTASDRITGTRTSGRRPGSPCRPAAAPLSGRRGNWPAFRSTPAS
ncbi:DUF427 domain-containing protein [Streptomyces sp. RB6PN25]|uniref:DUF427 domain-containing protein n=1 Tax=Streptomyces humicola TaxID=2953240 RepID=A0ABT1PQ79_9ACTN|nr:DUF427 domain-containing protein [Streptomyces humicola]MCQ4079075.1 DUF427 domain-containing protein [Streptomyces humicola]